MHVRPAHPALLVAILALFAALAAAPSSVVAAACGTGATSLGNGSFESPGVPPDSYDIFDASLVPPWNTTDSSNGIEIWGTGFGGVPAFDGGNFAELNANSFGTLYQDVVTTPGATMTWTLHHRGRDATDVMEVLIGDATTADVWTDVGWDVISGPIADTQFAWGTATDTYLVPSGQTCTRFAFRAVSSGVGSPSYGNFLDDIGFVVTIPAEPTPEPTPLATPAPTAAPTPVATPAPTPAPTPEPTPDPSPAATPALPAPAATPSADLDGAAAAVSTSRPRVTPPPTDTLGPTNHPDRGAGPTLFAACWLIVAGVFAGLPMRRPRRRR